MPNVMFYYCSFAVLLITVMQSLFNLIKCLLDIQRFVKVYLLSNYGMGYFVIHYPANFGVYHFPVVAQLSDESQPGGHLSRALLN